MYARCLVIHQHKNRSRKIGCKSTRDMKSETSVSKIILRSLVAKIGFNLQDIKKCVPIKLFIQTNINSYYMWR